MDFDLGPILDRENGGVRRVIRFRKLGMDEAVSLVVTPCKHTIVCLSGRCAVCDLIPEPILRNACSRPYAWQEFELGGDAGAFDVAAVAFLFLEGDFLVELAVQAGLGFLGQDAAGHDEGFVHTAGDS